MGRGEKLLLRCAVFVRKHLFPSKTAISVCDVIFAALVAQKLASGGWGRRPQTQIVRGLKCNAAGYERANQNGVWGLRPQLPGLYSLALPRRPACHQRRDIGLAEAGFR